MKPPKNKTIAIDIDDVLSDQKLSIIEFSNNVYGTNLTLDDFKRPGDYWGYWEMVWEVDASEGSKRLEKFIESDFSKKQKTIIGAQEVITELKKHYHLEVITSRVPEVLQLTQEWLKEHFPDTFRDIHFTNLWHADGSATKAEICQAIGAGYLVDDNIEHCELAAKAGIQPLLFGEYGWNMHHKLSNSIIRVKDWNDVAEFFHV